MITTSTDKVDISNKIADTNYTKTLTISSDNPRIDVKFFKNPLFRTKLQKYLFRVHNIKCSIGSERHDILLTMVGDKEQVKAGRDSLKNIFESTRTKIYNSEVTDQKSKVFNKHLSLDIFSIFQLFLGQKIFYPI
jgi:hypothetical protein